MMSGPSLSRILRRSALQSLPDRRSAHGRDLTASVRSSLFRGSIQPLRGRISCSGVRPFASAAGEPKYTSKEGIEEHRTREQRITKLRELQALQWPRIENSNGESRLSISEFKKGGSADQAVIIRGRILSVRKSSTKLVFIDIESSFDNVQVMLNYKHLEVTSGVTLEQHKLTLTTLLRGDFIEVKGRYAVTGKDTITLKADVLPKLLSPSLAPIPTKLTDDETIVQNRHLDLLVNREAADLLHLRSKLIWQMRNFFVGENFLEVQTPMLAEYAGGAAARPFLTSATEFPAKELALRIAPELWLKRLVVGGFDRIFEIGTAFRNEGLDGTHNPEFTMCEFYQAYASLPSLIELTVKFILTLEEFNRETMKQMSTTFNPPESTYFSKFEQIEFVPALEKALGMTFPDLADPQALELLVDALKTRGYEAPDNVSLNKLLDGLAGTYLEPESDTRPVFIIHHPACMSPLSKSFKCPTTGQLVSARAELFVKGREIANMYEEENDPFEQRRKFELQVQARDAANADADEGQAVVDESYIRALEHGLPPTGGWGCGVDRLVMLFSGATRISDTLSFGNLRNVIAATNISRRS